MIMKGKIAVHESEYSERVVKFVNLERFDNNFKELYNNGNINGLYYDDKGSIIASDTWGNKMSLHFGNSHNINL